MDYNLIRLENKIQNPQEKELKEQRTNVGTFFAEQGEQQK